MSDEETTTVEETQTEAPAEEAAAEATVVEPVAEVAEEPVVDEPAVEEEAQEAAAALGPVRVARVFICERGHRTTTLWGDPDICQARPLRSGPECGLQLYHITELPDQVQKALNPLKASKKSSKKK